jgi:hypothetical protein
VCSNQQSLVQLWPFPAREDLVLVDWLPWLFAGYNPLVYRVRPPSMTNVAPVT